MGIAGKNECIDIGEDIKLVKSLRSNLIFYLQKLM